MRNVVIIIVIILVLIILIALWINKGFGKGKKKKKQRKEKIETVKSTFASPQKIEINVVKNQIMAKWEKIPEATHYTAYYSTKPFEGKNTDKVLGPIKEEKFEMGCIPNGKYYFRITATRKDGKEIVESAPTEMKEIEINNCTAAKPPENLVAKRFDDEVLLTWDPSLDADRYEIVITDSDGAEKRIKIKDPSRSSYKIELDPAKEWNIHIEGENDYCKGKSVSKGVKV